MKKLIAEFYLTGDYTLTQLASMFGVSNSKITLILQELFPPKSNTISCEPPQKYNLSAEKTEEEMLNFCGYQLEDVILEL